MCVAQTNSRIKNWFLTPSRYEVLQNSNNLLKFKKIEAFIQSLMEEVTKLIPSIGKKKYNYTFSITTAKFRSF